MAAAVRNTIRFLLNDRLVELPGVPASQTLLDFLRLDRRLTGSKEGCAEGDCGACTVLVGRLYLGQLVYETVNACIRFTASLDGCHVVTVEHLSAADGALHPVQQAMADYHGSQCGFCTPGIVMSLYALWMANPNPETGAVEEALQGNLCRCTGYAPIVRAAQAVSADPGNDPLVAERPGVEARLRELQDGMRVETGPEDDRVIIPASGDDFAAAYAEHPDATIVAGATDVGLWVTKFMRPISPAIFIGNLDDLRHLTKEEDHLYFGAGASYEDVLPFIDGYLPQLSTFWRRIGGQQVRNMGTIGGNIANGSPIGDTPPPLIALGAEIRLRHGDKRRMLPLQDFFIDYGKQDRQPGEFVEEIVIPLPAPEALFSVYKLSKRRDEDISSVCGAFYLERDNGKVSAIRIAFGGMAATPKRAAKTEAALLGAEWGEAAVEKAVAALAEDYQPITDMRASAEYRLLAAQNMLRRFHLESMGETVQLSRGAA